MTNKDGLSRRDFLKRSAALGGALVWVTPVVQAVGMRPAFAQTVSPGGGVCDVFYAVKINPDDLPGPKHCISIHEQTDTGPAGHCLNVTEGGVAPIDGGCDFVTAVDVSNPKEFIITLAPGCEFQIGQAQLKSGPPCFASGLLDETDNTITFTHDAMDISHVEFVFCKVV